MKDVEKQYKHMMDKLKYEEVDNHNNWAVYFANGLKMRSEQSNASKKYQLQQLREYQKAMEDLEKKPKIPFYNWIEE